jgi:hypothetical protein
MASSSASSSATPFPEWLKPLLGDVHSISEAKKKITKHGKALELSGWHIDASLRERRRRLEDKISTILTPFHDQMEHRNWVKFIESSNAGHATLKPHINDLYKQMNDISEEYNKYVSFLDVIKDTTRELENKSETLSSALSHMKFTEKYRHLTYGDDYDAHQLRSAMNWDGWNK